MVVQIINQCIYAVPLSVTEGDEKNNSLATFTLTSGYGSSEYENYCLTFIGPCIANIILEYNQQVATFHSLFIPVRRSTCLRRGFLPSSAAQNCTYSVRYRICQTVTATCC